MTGGRDGDVCIVNTSGAGERIWRTQTVHDLLVVRNGDYLLMNTSAVLSVAQRVCCT